MKLTKHFLCLYILSVSFISFCSAEASDKHNFEANTDFSLQVRQLYLLSDITFSVRSLYLCLYRCGFEETRELQLDSSLLSDLAIDLNKFILEEVKEEFATPTLLFTNIYRKILEKLNNKLLQCVENNPNFELASLKSIVNKLEVLYNIIMKNNEILQASFFLDENISLTIKNISNTSKKIFPVLVRIVENELNRIDEISQKTKELKEYKLREESSNLSAHILIGCCNDGKCNSLDPSKKKEKTLKKKNRGGKKKRIVVKENQDEHDEFVLDQSCDKFELLNIICDDKLIKESVELVSRLIMLLEKIAKLEENLVRSSREFESKVNSLKKMENFGIDKTSNSLFRRFEKLIKEESNHKYSEGIFKIPRSDSSLRSISKSTLFQLCGISVDKKKNHCHHSTHKCKEKMEKLIYNPE
ncbi:uncharacterized protein ELE39_003278 [Cryptosporidium sp. chipmunk genotype I]|uniref:uncharacterized protein n=1 Tax=Cryptosporidium sp. chipmunk genotype I TaxID=1280935 RepID=UPI00351A96E3|nr:secreted protein [Cryptosporidium sp. chipmunk genotype I]